MDLTPTPLQAENFAKQHKFLEQLYQILDVDKEQRMSVNTLVHVTGAERRHIDFVLECLQEAKGYIMRFEWKRPSDTDPGKRSFWTLTIPYSSAKIALDKAQLEFTERMRRARSHPRSKNNGVAYSTGSDMPKGIGIKTFSPTEKQPKALVEAARMYGPKVAAAKQAYETLTSAGIEVNEQTFFETMSVPKDERLEAVALVLPYIDDLLSTIKQLKAERRSTEAPVRVAVASK